MRAAAKKNSKNKLRQTPGRRVVALKAKRPAKENSQQKEAKVCRVSYEALILNHRDNGRKLARSILRKWRVRMSTDDIDSVVDLTLCEAAQRFKPNKGASFMTFLYYHLRGHLVRAVAAASQSDNLFHAVSQQFSEEGEVKDGWVDPRHDLLRAYLAEELQENQNEQENPEEIVIRTEKQVHCQKAFDQLDELERLILKRLFFNNESLVDIARTLGYSRCHISRVKKRALDKLKESIEIIELPELGKPTGMTQIEREVVRATLRAQKRESRRNRRRRLAASRMAA